jgi:hypothetical protein
MVLRRLKQLGALSLKRSAYLLPDSDDGREDLEWVRKEILGGGGDAWIFRVHGVAGLSDDSAIETFRGLRARDFADLGADARALRDELRAGDATAGAPRRALRKLRERLDTLRRIDFFGAPGREEAEAIMGDIERTIRGHGDEGGAGGAMRGRTWITRRGVKCDRMASAWLIRRHIDPEARFAFVDPAAPHHDGRGVRFDMFEGEYTHEGERCTFEVLLARHGLEDPGLAVIGEIIHDIDYKEDRFARPETAGIALLLEGIAARHPDDERRLEESAAVFDALHARLLAR